jgi:hypothetical protein
VEHTHTFGNTPGSHRAINPAAELMVTKSSEFSGVVEVERVAQTRFETIGGIIIGGVHAEKIADSATAASIGVNKV